MDRLTILLSRCPIRAARHATFRSIAAQLTAATPRSLAAGLNVRFAGEAAYDAGGVTKELFSVLATQNGDEALLQVLRAAYSAAGVVRAAAVAALLRGPCAASPYATACPVRIPLTAFRDVAPLARAPPPPQTLEDGTLHIRPRAEAPSGARATSAAALCDYHALGRLLGCALAAACMHEDAVVFPLPLSSALRKMVTDAALLATDVRATCPMLFRLRCEALLEPGGIAAVAAALCEDSLRFVTDDEPPVELTPGGAGVVVSEANVHEYACLLAEHILCGDAREELHAVLQGFWSVVPLGALLHARIDALDLGMLLSGVPTLDVDDWEAHTRIESTAEGASASLVSPAAHDMCERFFRVLRAFDAEMQSRVFAFTTSLHRLPAGGFAALAPPFTIQVLGPSFRGRLPVAHTCFNALQLAPLLSTADSDQDAALSKALTMAVSMGGEGFELA